MQKFFIFLFIFVLGLSYTFSQNTKPSPVKIGIVFDGPWDRNEEIFSLVQQEISDLTTGEFDVQFPADKNIIADWTVESINVALEQLLSDPQVDIVIAGGLLTSQEICRRKVLPKPAVAPVVIDPSLQGLPYNEGKSGIKNLCYVFSPLRLFREIQTFREIISFNKLFVLTSEAFYKAVPSITQKSDSLAKVLGVDAKILPVGRSAESVLNTIPPDAEAVYVGHLLQMPKEEFNKLVQGFINRRLPSFALLGKMDVEQGIFAGLMPDTYFPRLARRIALIIQRILLGEEPSEIPVAFAQEDRLTINMATARAINIYPNWSVMTEAELINPIREEVSRSLNLSKVVKEALQVNLNLRASERSVAAGSRNVNIARSSLLPQLELSGLGLLIDQDRAESSFGSQSEKTVSGSVSITQVLFSERALANISIQKELQRERILADEQLKLDIIQIAATAYLNVLRAKTFERIQRENLRRTQVNLELAQVRESIGQSGSSEVYRWESQIATNRKDVIQANSQRNIAEIELNRILNRNLEEKFATEEADLNDPLLLISHQEFLNYMESLPNFKILRDFLVKEALNYSPEIHRLDAAISAQSRFLKSTKNAFWLPTLALQGEISRRFKHWGVGSESSLSSSGLFPIEFPQPDDTDWNVAINLSFPLFRGTAKFSEQKQALDELEKLGIERSEIAKRIEQRIRTALHFAGASRAAIQQTRFAEEAAQKNLDLVVEAYSRGAVSIIELIDAQNAALIADEGFSSAIYDFLIDFIEVERSLGKFNFLKTRKEQIDFFERLDRYYNENKSN